MGVYSTMLPDEKLLKAVEGLEKIVVLGCVICANSSLALAKGVPLNKVSVNKETGKMNVLPVAIVDETNRVKAILEKKVKDVRVDVAPGFCIISEDNSPGESGWVGHCNDARAVVALCCAGGVAGLRVRLGKSVKIIPAMRTEGLTCNCSVRDKDSGYVYLDKNKSQVIRNFGSKRADREK
jgi:hypothetical protein